MSNTEKVKAKVPYSAGVSHRASNTFRRKFDPAKMP
jgi:hypothetical protein